MQWTVTAPIELLWFIAATPTQGPFNAQISDTIDRKSHYLGTHYATDHWHDRPQWLQPPALMHQAGKHMELPDSQILGTWGWMDKRRRDAAPLLTQTHQLWEVKLAGSKFAMENKDL